MLELKSVVLRQPHSRAVVVRMNGGREFSEFKEFREFREFRKSLISLISLISHSRTRSEATKSPFYQKLRYCNITPPRNP